jgi:hypothetical protein
MFREALSKTLAWVIERMREGLSFETIDCTSPYPKAVFDLQKLNGVL